MMQHLRAAVTLVGFFTLLLGLVYPLVVTAFAQLLFQEKANGSLIERGGRVVGSSLLGQQFSSPRYFWSRPSATTPPYNAAASGGSNLAVTNPAFYEAIEARVVALQKADPQNTALIPVDLVTASASGLDPHISLPAADYQVSRVARARRMDETVVRSLIAEFTLTPAFGEPYVNVLELNLALDKK